MNKYLIVGLGNVGSMYNNTRHNAGFSVLDCYAKRNSLSFDDVKYALRTDFHFKGKTLILIKPTTYMNLSGKAVLHYLNNEKIKLENILIIVDDLDISINKLKIKNSGSNTKGHNGLIDIESKINTTNYCKLKFGIGRNFIKGRQAEFVLSKWNKEEEDVVNKKIEYCSYIIEKFAVTPIDLLKNEVNSIVFN